MFIELWPLSTMNPSGATCRSCPAPTPKALAKGDDRRLSLRKEKDERAYPETSRSWGFLGTVNELAPGLCLRGDG
jgi:hypothetical protein